MNGRERQAAALAFMRIGKHDIRPDLLLYVVEHDDERFTKLFCHGCNYLAVHCARANMDVPEDAIQLAVVDALSILRTRKAAYSLRERARELNLRAHVYGALRKIATRLFEQRYEEALKRFQMAMRGSDLHPAIGNIRSNGTHRSRSVCTNA